MDEDLKQLKALSLVINMGVLVKVEAILGVDRINEMKTNAQCEVTVAEKVLLLKAIGYDEAEALALDPAVCEAEVTVFFTNWLEKLLQGRYAFMHSQPSPTKSTGPAPSRKTSKPKEKAAKTSSRKASRSRR